MKKTVPHTSRRPRLKKTKGGVNSGFVCDSGHFTFGYGSNMAMRRTTRCASRTGGADDKDLQFGSTVRRIALKLIAMLSSTVRRLAMSCFALEMARAQISGGRTYRAN
jgi:hypothetical protein